MSDTAFVAAPNAFVDAANGVRYCYRHVGTSTSGRPPLLLLQHFRGSLDSWDPLLVDELAAEREVIAVDNTGVGLSAGTTPSTVAEMARDAIAFCEASGLTRVDLLGFSLGGFVAQDIALTRPDLVNRLVLAGTGPQGAPGMHGWRQDIADWARLDQPGAESVLYIFFAHTATSQALGGEFLGRAFQPRDDHDGPVTFASRDAQYDAVVHWGIPDLSKLQRLTGIRQRTLILQGDNDLMIPTKGSHLMAGLIPDATLHIFPDAAHASLFQYPREAADVVNAFLDA